MNSRFIAIFLLQQVSQRDNSKSSDGIRRLLHSIALSVAAGISAAVGLLALTYLIASPPMDLWYQIAEPAGNSTVYVPGKNSFL